MAFTAHQALLFKKILLFFNKKSAMDGPIHYLEYFELFQLAPGQQTCKPKFLKTKLHQEK